MADTWTSEEQGRFEAMQHLRISGVRAIAHMVPRLHELGLLECQKCEEPSNQRKNSEGQIICTTCENTASVFWSKNLARLRVENLDILEMTWEWIETKREIRRRALTRGETSDLKLASEITDQIARFAGVDIEIGIGPEDPEDEAQNVPRGLAVKRSAARRDPATVH